MLLTLTILGIIIAIVTWTALSSPPRGWADRRRDEGER
jgi:hypothetical protein